MRQLDTYSLSVSIISLLPTFSLFLFFFFLFLFLFFLYFSNIQVFLKSSSRAGALELCIVRERRFRTGGGLFGGENHRGMKRGVFCSLGLAIRLSVVVDWPRPMRLGKGEGESGGVGERVGNKEGEI